ncbi:unnamed protein product [Ectocarpus sp. 12 AP-2014]
MVSYIEPQYTFAHTLIEARCTHDFLHSSMMLLGGLVLCCLHSNTTGLRQKHPQCLLPRVQESCRDKSRVYYFPKDMSRLVYRGTYYTAVYIFSITPPSTSKLGTAFDNASHHCLPTTQPHSVNLIGYVGGTTGTESPQSPEYRTRLGIVRTRGQRSYDSMLYMNKSSIVGMRGQ